MSGALPSSKREDDEPVTRASSTVRDIESDEEDAKATEVNVDDPHPIHDTVGWIPAGEQNLDDYFSDSSSDYSDGSDTALYGITETQKPKRVRSVDFASSSASSLSSSLSSPVPTATVTKSGPASSSAASATPGGSSISVDTSSDSDSGMWICAICTFAENPMSTPICMVCGALPQLKAPSVATRSGAKKTGGLADVAGHAFSPTASSARSIPSKADRFAKVTGGSGVGSKKRRSTLAGSHGKQKRELLKKKTTDLYLSLEKEFQQANAESLKRASILDGKGSADGLHMLVVASEAASRDRGGAVSPKKGMGSPSSPHDSAPSMKKSSSVSSASGSSRSAKSSGGSGSGSRSSTGLSSSSKQAKAVSEASYKIAQRLAQITSKEMLMDHLATSCARVSSKQADLESQIALERKNLTSLAMGYRKEKSIWKRFYSLVLLKKCEEFFKIGMKYYHLKIEILMSEKQVYTDKFEILQLALTQYKIRYDEWSITKLRENVITAMTSAFQVRLDSETYAKKCELNDKWLLEYAQVKESYETLKAIEGRAKLNMEEVVKEFERDLNKILDRFNLWRKGSRLEGNDSLETCYKFINGESSGAGGFSEEDRQRFYRYIFDQRLKTGKTLHLWLKNQISKSTGLSTAEELTLEEIFDFVNVKMMRIFLMEEFRSVFVLSDVSVIMASPFISEADIPSELSKDGERTQRVKLKEKMVKSLLFECLLGGKEVNSLRDTLRILSKSIRIKQEFRFLKTRTTSTDRVRVGKSLGATDPEILESLTVFVQCVQHLVPEIAKVDGMHSTTKSMTHFEAVTAALSSK